MEANYENIEALLFAVREQVLLQSQSRKSF